MLILTRRPGETLLIGDNIKITVVDVDRNQVRVGIDAPQEVKIVREELLGEGDGQDVA
jgi:carbon storage regulator